ncbi:MAG: hypothetical protein MZU91_00430 [Desulfosudis oleivorans]|nr:hypothetical protein [Desulfosudis oleivorans]
MYEKDAQKYERVGEWIERIGWEKFFEHDRHCIHRPAHRRLHLHERHHEDCLHVQVVT